MKIDDVSLTIFAWDNIPATTYGGHSARAAGRLLFCSAISTKSRIRLVSVGMPRSTARITASNTRGLRPANCAFSIATRPLPASEPMKAAGRRPDASRSALNVSEAAINTSEFVSTENNRGDGNMISIRSKRN